MLGTPYQTKLTFLANLLTFLRILLQRKLDYDSMSRRKAAPGRGEPAGCVLKARRAQPGAAQGSRPTAAGLYWLGSLAHRRG